MNWLRRILGLTDRVADRVDAAGERYAAAFEAMADDVEAIAREHRLRLGGVPVTVSATTIIDNVPEEATTAHRNGRRNGKAAV